MEITENQLKKIEEATKAVAQLNQIGMVCLMYNQGASAETCMERIKKIITEGE